MRRRRVINHVPLLPAATGIASGIAAASKVSVPPTLALAALAVLTVAAFAAGRWPRLRALVSLAAFFAVGLLVAPGSGQQLPKGEWMDGVVMDRPSEKPRTVLVDVLFPTCGTTERLLLWKDDRSLALGPAAAVQVCLPDSGFFVWSDWWRPGGTAVDSLSRVQRARLWCMMARQKLLTRYRRLPATDEQIGVLAALTLGSKSGLSSDIRNVYGSTGASHVLALSGLHLSIIFTLLSSLLLARRFVLGRVALIVSLWAFAFLTGLSPSIVRAATMLSVYVAFCGRSQRGASLNVLFFTAMLMLLVDAPSLFDVGFQLSFASVVAIVLFTPLLTRFLPLRWMQWRGPLRWVCNLATVSVAAQIGTAPLIAFHFGRFATYFLLANFVAIPLATAILWLALPVLLLQWQPLDHVIVWLVDAMNKGLELIASLPMASIDGLAPSVLQTVLFYVLAAIVYLALYRIADRR